MLAIEWSQGIEDAWSDVAAFVPKLVAAIVVVGSFAALDQLQVAENVVATLLQTLVYGLGLILVISLGVGGIASARDRFWPAVYGRLTGDPDTESSPVEG